MIGLAVVMLVGLLIFILTTICINLNISSDWPCGGDAYRAGSARLRHLVQPRLRRGRVSSSTNIASPIFDRRSFEKKIYRNILSFVQIRLVIC